MVVCTMLEHDRCTFSIVVQTTTKSLGYCHDKRLQIPRAHVVRDATLGAPAALMLIGFRCVCAITAQMPQKPRKRRS